MIGRKTRLVLGGVIGLLAVLPSSTAVGSIFCDRQVIEELLDNVAAVDAGQGMTPAAPRPSPPRDDEEKPPTVDQLEGLVPAGAAAGQPSSVSNGTGAGASLAAMTAAFWALPQLPLWTGLPGEARTIMPTGPPFELLRPPRSV